MMLNFPLHGALSVMAQYSRPPYVVQRTHPDYPAGFGATRAARSPLRDVPGPRRTA
jgi:hypothetical protein